MNRNILNNMYPTPSEPAAPTKKSVQRKAGSSSTMTTAIKASKSTVGKNMNVQPNSEKVALRAYYIGESRRTLGIPGDENSDWLQAEREISEELKCYQFATKKR